MCYCKLNFNSHYSSLQCHMILQKSFWYADMLLKKHLQHFCEFLFSFRIFLWIESSKVIFCNIINVFTVTFDQLNASLLNKSINVFQFWMVSSLF